MNDRVVVPCGKLRCNVSMTHVCRVNGKEVSRGSF